MKKQLILLFLTNILACATVLWLMYTHTYLSYWAANPVI